MPKVGQRKRLTRRKRTMSAPAILCHTRPPAKRKQRSNQQMEEAMKAVQKGDIGINQAARDYGIHSPELP